MKHSQNGGKLMLCLNSPNLSAQWLKNMVADECSECTFIETITAPMVFKEAHKGKGLKILLFSYLN